MAAARQLQNHSLPNTLRHNARVASMWCCTSPAGTRAYFGDLESNFYALDATNGRLIWQKKLDNQAFTRITGYTTDDVQGQYPSYLRSDYDDSVVYDSIWNGLRFRGQWQGEAWDRKKDGEASPALVHWRSRFEALS